MPAAIAVKRSEGDKSLISIQSPELAGKLKAALILGTG